MWRRVPCEQPLHTGQSILSPRRNPMLMNAGCHITIKNFFLLVLAYAFAYLLSWDCSPVKRERELGNCTYTDALFACKYRFGVLLFFTQCSESFLCGIRLIRRNKFF